MHSAERFEQLRREALAELRANRGEESLRLLDEALPYAQDEIQRELLTIDRAQTLIMLERKGPEIQKLPSIVLRRRNPRHVLLAAYNLLFKLRLEQEFSRARSYGRVALEALEEIGEPLEWKPAILAEMGSVSLLDSDLDEAVRCFDEALALLQTGSDQDYSRALVLQNLGYARLLQGQIEEGIERIHQAIELMRRTEAGGFIAESYIDLCFGYLEFGDLESARQYGELGLELATEHRQVRNAHYLLGEVFYKLGDRERADIHFENLARFYPQFPGLKDMLHAIDLRAMVNLKL